MAKSEIEAVIDEIEALMPGAFTGIAPGHEWRARDRLRC
jgi:hypothetical protein